MSQNILTTVKKNIGIAESDNSFDLDVRTFINGAIMKLTQVGVGPSAGFSVVTGDETWDDFLGVDAPVGAIPQYLSLAVRVVFDPPAFSFHLNALQEELKEMLWRIQVSYDPAPSVDLPTQPVYVIDGGHA